MKNEDVMIIGLAIIVLIVGSIAMLVTGMGANVDTATPFESSSSHVNTTNMTNTTTDSAHRDTGMTAPTGESSSSSGSSSNYEGSSSVVPSDTTPSSGSSDSGRSDSRGSDSGQGGQTPSDNVVPNLE